MPYLPNIKLLLALLLLPFALQAQKVNDIIKDHYKAIGQKKLLKVQTATVKGSLAMMARNGQFTLYLKRPGMLRNEGRLIDVSSITVMKGNKGFQSLEGQAAQEIPVPQLKSQLKYTSIDDPLYEAQHAKAVITYQGKEHRDNKTVYQLKAAFANGDSTVFFIDVTTHYLILSQAYSNAPGTLAGRTDKVYSDYIKEENGVVLPHKIVITQLIEQIQAKYTVTVDKITFNPVLLPKLFDKP